MGGSYKTEEKRQDSKREKIKHGITLQVHIMRGLLLAGRGVSSRARHINKFVPSIVY